MARLSWFAWALGSSLRRSTVHAQSRKPWQSEVAGDLTCGPGRWQQRLCRPDSPPTTTFPPSPQKPSPASTHSENLIETFLRTHIIFFTALYIYVFTCFRFFYWNILSEGRIYIRFTFRFPKQETKGPNRWYHTFNKSMDEWMTRMGILITAASTSLTI